MKTESFLNATGEGNEDFNQYLPPSQSEAALLFLVW